MSTITLTTAGITSPSSTHKAYKNAISVRPPASGSNIGGTELTTSEYTGISTSNDIRVWYQGYNYAAIQVNFFVDSAYRDISQIVVTMEGSGNDGYGVSGCNFYIKNNNTNTWEYLTASSSGSDASMSSTKTTNLSYYVDANYYIKILAVAVYYDGNGSGSYISIDQAYATLTYTPSSGPAFVPRITMIS